MSKRTRPHREALLELLRDPYEAAAYLNAAEESGDMFLVALRNVAEAFQMSKVAAAAGVSRESLYRMLSEKGNPTHDSLRGIAKALGLKPRWEVDTPKKPSGRAPVPLSDEIATSGIDAEPPKAVPTDDKVIPFDVLRNRIRVKKPVIGTMRSRFRSAQGGTGG